MDAEFINEYIGRLTQTIHDLISKNVLLETRLAVLEKSSANLQMELQNALQEVERFKKKPLKQNLDSESV